MLPSRFEVVQKQAGNVKRRPVSRGETTRVLHAEVGGMHGAGFRLTSTARRCKTGLRSRPPSQARNCVHDVEREDN
jgi:hypothetical protein